jgi:hypothetical protein
MVADIMLMSLKAVGKQLSESGFTPDEVDLHARALGDMFCAYIESFSPEWRSPLEALTVQFLELARLGSTKSPELSCCGPLAIGDYSNAIRMLPNNAGLFRERAAAFDSLSKMDKQQADKLSQNHKQVAGNQQ